MTDSEKKLAFLLATSPYLDTVDGSYDEAAMDLVANGVVPVVRCRDCKHWLKDVPGCTDFLHGGRNRVLCVRRTEGRRMNIEEQKKKMFVELAELEKEAKILLERIQAFYVDLDAVHTAEEADEFDRTHDIEEGFHHIKLF